MKKVAFNIDLPEGPVSWARFFSRFAVWNDGPFILADFFWKPTESPGPIRMVASIAFFGPLLKESVPNYKRYLAETGSSIDLSEFESFKVGPGIGADSVPEMFDIVQCSAFGNCGEVSVCQFPYHRVLSKAQPQKGRMDGERKNQDSVAGSNLCLLRSVLPVHRAFMQTFIEAIEKAQTP